VVGRLGLGTLGHRLGAHGRNHHPFLTGGRVS
jgi:hypothetical protein